VPLRTNPLNKTGITIMKILIMTLLFLFGEITTVHTQSLSKIYRIKTGLNIPNKTDNKYSPISINSSFTYMFIGNSGNDCTNSKGFSLDFQINQENYTSWIIGCNFNFYKSYYTQDTTNLSLINLYLGPKFYFSKDKFSTYARTNAGISFFDGKNPSAINIAFSLFPALGIEYQISKNFKITLEPNINVFLFGDFYGSFGYFGINTGISTNFY